MPKTIEKMYQDKILPVQKKQCKLYKGNQARLIEEMHSVILDYCNIQDPRKIFDLETSPWIPLEEMISNPLMLRMLESLVLILRPKKILEIGTFIGVSAMSMARVLPKGGKVVTVEKYEQMAQIAKRNFFKNGFKNSITLIEGGACDQRRAIKKFAPFDMIFIDGDKEEYMDYFAMADSLLPVGGLMVLNAMFFYGDALNRQPVTSKGKIVRKTMLKIKSLKNYHKLILPLADGYMLLVKTGR